MANYEYGIDNVFMIDMDSRNDFILLIEKLDNQSEQDAIKFSVPKLRDWLKTNVIGSTDELSLLVGKLFSRVPEPYASRIITGLIRFSYLIELTKRDLTSTKMKIRWKSCILPDERIFSIEKDPRAASSDECNKIFCKLLSKCIASKDSLDVLLPEEMGPMYFPVGYIDYSLDKIHSEKNVDLLNFDCLNWILKVRKLLSNNQDLKQIFTKLMTKTYRTDRSLTGKDKSNRAYRWEILNDDYQFASKENCWEIEKSLIEQLFEFDDAPINLKKDFIANGLLTESSKTALCPITLEQLRWSSFADNSHGKSKVQIGHLTPLKQNGKHLADNICWQSRDGNRIQGNLSIQETHDLIISIARRLQMAQDEEK